MSRLQELRTQKIELDTNLLSIAKELFSSKKQLQQKELDSHAAAAKLRAIIREEKGPDGTKLHKTEAAVESEFTARRNTSPTIKSGEQGLAALQERVAALEALKSSHERNWQWLCLEMQFLVNHGDLG